MKKMDTSERKNKTERVIARLSLEGCSLQSDTVVIVRVDAAPRQAAKSARRNAAPQAPVSGCKAKPPALDEDRALIDTFDAAFPPATRAELDAKARVLARYDVLRQTQKALGRAKEGTEAPRQAVSAARVVD